MRKSVYWMNMNAGIEKTTKQCAICLDYWLTQPHKKTIPCKVSCKPLEVAGADIFLLNNYTLLCTADYYIVKKKTTVLQPITNLKQLRLSS